MPFGNGSTSCKKAGFPDVGHLYLVGFEQDPVAVAKLGVVVAGRFTV